MDRYKHDGNPDPEGFYHGFDPLQKRDVFIRVLPQRVSDSVEGRERFLRAAQSAARLNHPNVISVYDVGEHRGADYLVLEVMGPSLKAFCATPLEPRSLSEKDRRRVLTGVLQALDYAHQHGLVHCCLCRDNIRLCTRHQVKVYGFGFDYVERQYFDGDGLPECWYFMAPEQARGERVDRRADLYAVGVLMHQLWTGRFPFVGKSLPMLVSRVLQGASLDLEGVPERVASAIERCLAPDRVERFQSVAELQAHLDEVDIS